MTIVAKAGTIDSVFPGRSFKQLVRKHGVSNVDTVVVEDEDDWLLLVWWLDELFHFDLYEGLPTSCRYGSVVFMAAPPVVTAGPPRWFLKKAEAS